MYGVKFREELDEPVAREFDSLVAKLKAFLLAEHNEDGTHRQQSMLSALDPDASGETAQGNRWWKAPGAWELDNPNSATPHVVGLRPPDPAAGTYNDYAPQGIDNAVVLEIEPTGDITLTGLKAPKEGRKRFLLLRNRDSSNSITLKDASASSEVQNVFDLPDALGGGGGGGVSNHELLDGDVHTDTVVQTVSRGSLIYGDSTPKWNELVVGAANTLLKSDGTDVSWSQVDLTTDVTGSLPTANGGSEVIVVRRLITEAEWESISSSPITLVAALGDGQVICPLYGLYSIVVTGEYTTSPTVSLEWTDGTNCMNFGSLSFTTVGTKSAHALGATVTDSNSTMANLAVVTTATSNPGNAGGTGHVTGVITFAYVVLNVAVT